MSTDAQPCMLDNIIVVTDAPALAVTIRCTYQPQAFKLELTCAYSSITVCASQSVSATIHDISTAPVSVLVHAASCTHRRPHKKPR
jgi:hypothetical protein